MKWDCFSSVQLESLFQSLDTIGWGGRDSLPIAAPRTSYVRSWQGLCFGDIGISCCSLQIGFAFVREGCFSWGRSWRYCWIE